MTSQDLAALIGSRICHDLISPIGAIGNGLELLQMSNPAGSPEMDLIAQSVANANARIRFFRVAYGASNRDQRIGKTEVASILADMTRGGRLQIDWQSEADLPRGEVKLVFLLLQCLESAMPYGGRITVSQGWTLTGVAARLRVTPLWDMLGGGEAEVGASDVHFALAPTEAAQQRLGLSVKTTETEICIQVG